MNPTDRSEKAKTGGHLFVKILQSKNVEFVFGTTGAGMPDIQDAMVVEKPPKWIQGLHEFVSVSAASGYALASNKAGVALIDRVVGTQNAVGAFFGAFHNSSPAVVFASTNLPGLPIETGAPELHYSSFQTLALLPWIKWFTQVNDNEAMTLDVEKAFNVALSEHQGPVYVMLRQDLMAKRLRKKEWNDTITQPVLSGTVPDDKTIDKIIQILLEHEQPEIIVSYAGRHPEAVDSLVTFAHKFGISVRERRFFMNYPTNDQLHLGFVHRYKPPEARKNSDLVIALEFGLLPHQNFGELDAIDLNSDPLHRQDVYSGGDYGASLFPCLIRASCNISKTLTKIGSNAEKRIHFNERRQIRDRIQAVTSEHNNLIRQWSDKAESSFEKERLDDWSIGFLINRHLRKTRSQFTWVNGTASSYDALLRTVEATLPGTYFGNPSGHLGVAAGMSYGAALAYRKYVKVENKRHYKIGSISKQSRPVVCTIGGMAMQFSETFLQPFGHVAIMALEFFLSY